MRSAAALPVEQLGAPMDVLWFRLPGKPDDPAETIRDNALQAIGPMLSRLGITDVPSANDLVVDHASSIELADGLSVPSANVLEFGEQPDVHHCNYFEHRKTLERFGVWLKN